MRIIESDIEIFAAALLQTRITVWQQSESDSEPVLIDYGGVVNMFTPDSIRIDGNYFLRAVCQFRIGGGA